MYQFPFDLENLEYIFSLYENDPKCKDCIGSHILENMQRLDDIHDYQMAVTKCCNKIGIEPTENAISQYYENKGWTKCGNYNSICSTLYYEGFFQKSMEDIKEWIEMLLQSNKMQRTEILFTFTIFSFKFLGGTINNHNEKENNFNLLNILNIYKNNFTIFNALFDIIK